MANSSNYRNNVNSVFTAVSVLSACKNYQKSRFANFFSINYYNRDNEKRRPVIFERMLSSL